MTYQPTMLAILIVGLLMISACQGGGSAQRGASQGDATQVGVSQQNSVESALRAVAAGNGAELSVVYDDMHGLWGGQTITIAGNGAYERKERARGDSTPKPSPAGLSTSSRFKRSQACWSISQPGNSASPSERRSPTRAARRCGFVWGSRGDDLGVVQRSAKE